MTTFDTLLGRGSVEELKRTLAGDVIVPGDPGVRDRAPRLERRDRPPARADRPLRGVADVVEAVRFARSERLLTAVRGGAHNVAGQGTCDGGIVIDLSLLRGVEIDPVARTARVAGRRALGRRRRGGAGPRARHAGRDDLLDRRGGADARRRHRPPLAQARAHVRQPALAAELVTADGNASTASATEHPDLFWALRGGGGNFGVVTAFTFRLHPVGTVLGGMLLIGLEDAAAFLRGFRELALPDELGVVFNFIAVPPAPDSPAELHGRRCSSRACASPATSRRASGRSRRSGDSRRCCWSAWRRCPTPCASSSRTPSAPAGMGNYWKSGYLTGLDDGLLERSSRARARRRTRSRSCTCTFSAAPRGASPRTRPRTRIAPRRTCSRSSRCAPTVEDARAPVEWARAFWSELEPYASGAYVNFPGEDGSVRDAYPGHYERLAAVKAAWDPTNLFRLNHNIEPARAQPAAPRRA